MIEHIVSRGFDNRQSLHQLSRGERAMHGTEEASNDGRVRVRIIHGLNISQRTHILIAKIYKSSKTKY